MKVFQKIARNIATLNRESTPIEWRERAEQTIFDIEKEFLPSGSGFDSGCTVNLDKSTPEKLIIECPFHCMDEHGFYDGWVYPAVIVTPSLSFEFGIKINWKGYRGKYKDILSDYIIDTMYEYLTGEVN